MSSEAHVLVVEDEPSFSEALTIGLEREGFRVTTVPDGAAGGPVARRVDAVEAFEDAVEVARRDADPVVDHRNAHHLRRPTGSRMVAIALSMARRRPGGGGCGR